MASEDVKQPEEERIEEAAEEQAEEPVQESAASSEFGRPEQERDELREMLQRQVAEFQNYKKRIDRDHVRLRDQITMDVLREFLPVMDDFDRALAAAEHTDLAGMREGLSMIAAALAHVLANHGVEEICALGELFDHRLHDALTQLPDPGLPEGTIKEVFCKGYRLHGKLLRPSQVIVASGGPRAEIPASFDDNGDNGDQAKVDEAASDA